MEWFTTPSTVAASIFAVVTSILFYRARNQYRMLRLLPALPPSPAPPDCMVVIPARNEEGVVGDAVRSLPPDTVIVVDDHSTDRTADEAREAGAGVLEAPPLAPAVSGKANACMAGARILTSRWILFADADTRYGPGFLESVVQFAEQTGAALVSVHLTPRPESVAESLLEPYTAALFFSAASPRRDPASMFSGRCILARREAYEFVGGHAAVRQYLAEDVKLALLAERHRLGFAVVLAGGLGSVRSFAGWKGAWSAIERNAFRLVHEHPWTSLAILVTALCAALWLPLAAWLWLAGHRAGAGAVVLLVLLELRPWYANGLRILLGPIAIYAALPFLVHGLMGAIANRGLEWKGRAIKPS